MKQYRLKNLQSKRFTLATLLAVTILACGAGFLFAHLVADIPETSSCQSVRLGSQGLTNPLLYISSQEKSARLKPLERSLNDVVAHDISNGSATNVSVYVQDLTTGNWTGVNENDKFSPASLLKVSILIAYLKSAESNPSILNEPLQFNGSSDANDSEDIKPLKEIVAYHPYTVDELLRFLIEYSDNNANALLVARIGSDPILTTMQDLHMPVSTSTVATDDFLSPKEYSRFFRVLYSATYLNKDFSEKALTLLSHADFPQGIEAGVPEGIIVAQKFGERNVLNESGANKELHDCGIVYHPKSPYVLCVMTKGADFTKLTQVIRDVSGTVWKQMDADHR